MKRYGFIREHERLKFRIGNLYDAITDLVLGPTLNGSDVISRWPSKGIFVSLQP